MFKLKSIPVAPEKFKLDGESGEFEGYASVFGVRDHGGDVVERPAFDRTIAERLPQKLIKIFRNHHDPVGMPIVLRPDDYGLFVHGKVDVSLPKGRETIAEMKSGLLSHMSFAYDVVRAERGEDASGRAIYRLLDLELYEVGPVYWPMNDAARIESVKAIREVLGTSPVELTLADAVLLLKSRVDLLEKSEITDRERLEVKDAQRVLGSVTRTLAALPRTREDLAAAPEPTEQKTASLDLSGVMAALETLRSAGTLPASA
jgi:HK97 family phage prohead protease